jgi:sensor histidine kinase YesM
MKKFLTSVWLLGLVIAIPVIISLPGFFRKYKANLALQEPAAHKITYRIFFRDLDGNGIKQKVYVFPNSAGQLAFQYFRDDGGMINQINFRHKFSPFLLYLFFGDADKNGKTEVYGFTLEKDSLFLNRADLNNPYSNSSESKYITRVGTFENGTLNFSVNRFAVADIDSDDNNEIVFSIVSGYSKFPRMVVIFHPDTGELEQSKDEGMNPYFMSFYDLNRDGKMEILAGSSAGFNLTDTATNLAADIRPYLLSYKSDLKYLFPPVPFSSGINNHLQVFVNNPKLKEILVFQFNRSLATEKILGIYKVDFSGNLTDSIFLAKFGKRFPYQVFQEKGYYWIYTGDKMVSIDNKLNIREVKDIEISNSIYRNPFSLQGCPEYATVDLLMKKACIYMEDFDHKIEMEYADETIKNIILDTGKGPEYFLIQTNNSEYTYRILKNWLYYLKFPFYILIYLLSVLFVWLIQRIREKQLHERYELQNQLRDVEIKYLRMQMDPHFMFNAFNSMALLMKNGEQEEAFDAFMKFTKMVRSNFDFSDRFSRPLSEEMQMVNHFLDINKLRFREKLDFRITIAEDVPMNMLIPKMMLQIHIENALKHGLAKLEKSGSVEIDIIREGEGIRVSIEDNGIGRRKAAQMNTDSTKQGLKMLQAIYERLSQQSKTKIIQETIDLMDEQGNPAGTRVEIYVPLSLKEPSGV